MYGAAGELLAPVQEAELDQKGRADDLSADVARRLARALKTAEAQPGALPPVLLIADLRGQQASSLPEVETADLLRAVNAAATGAADDRQRLSHMADAAWAAPFDAERLEFQIAALARSLSRMPAAELRSGRPSHMLLVELRNTLRALTNS